MNEVITEARARLLIANRRAGYFEIHLRPGISDTPIPHPEQFCVFAGNEWHLVPITDLSMETLPNGDIEITFHNKTLLALMHDERAAFQAIANEPMSAHEILRECLLRLGCQLPVIERIQGAIDMINDGHSSFKAWYAETFASNSPVSLRAAIRTSDGLPFARWIVKDFRNHLKRLTGMDICKMDPNLKPLRHLPCRLPKFNP